MNGARSSLLSFRHAPPQPRQPLHNSHRLQTYTIHLPEQPQNILRIIPLIRNIRDTALYVSLDTLLVNDLVERHEVGVDGHVSGSGR